MRKMFVIVLALVIGLALATAGFAAEKAKSMTYTGEVSSVDASAKSLVVKGKDGDKTFDVTDSKWKGYTSMDEIKPGDKVTVTYMDKDGTMSAKNVAKTKVKSKTTTKTKSTTKETTTDSPGTESK